jgi:hypothetical protein
MSEENQGRRGNGSTPGADQSAVMNGAAMPERKGRGVPVGAAGNHRDHERYGAGEESS